MSRRSQLQQKRHTKPCKYFQVNRCPHPADVCDFAHVITNPMTIMPDRQSEMCSYYYAGLCMSGAHCRSMNRFLAWSVASNSVAGWTGLAVDGTYPDNPTVYGNYPAFPPSWPPSAYSPLSPSIENALLNHPPRSRDSVETSSTSISSLESDDSSAVTEDPQFQEHPHSHQSQVRISDDSPIIHVPPFLPLPYMTPAGPLSPPGYDFVYPSLTTLKLPGPMKPKGPKPPSKQKILKYKTKPCKFFPTERGCPNGSACTFIHDEELPVMSSPTSSKPSSPIKEDSDRKGFVPVPWRVIGGGVLVGIKKDDTDYDSALDSDDSSDEQHRQKTSKGAAPMAITRKRSNSIPSTPSIAQIKVGSLFSAESPGVL
ncbi:hypothetical protein CVT26_004325 [Gymnopilus dilepis]|uniref:C3H1-type domain-containing protein n=1 Tax=Gymnopilus dilepis TaxID=231916 RepID=A0A409W2B6_9AGAR|nr:hypothetical protein CVT26_004325 [Gymnopilus dilepis]